MRTLTRFVAAVVTAAVVPACSVIASSVVHADPVATTASVLQVVDGDTVDIVDDVRGRLRIRLLGIDTPETKKPGYSVGCWGPETTSAECAATASHAPGEEPRWYSCRCSSGRRAS